MTSPVDPAREDEYNDWYDNTHVPEICAVLGFVFAWPVMTCGRTTHDELTDERPGRLVTA
jgi:hypothetical protein